MKTRAHKGNRSLGHSERLLTRSQVMAREYQLALSLAHGDGDGAARLGRLPLFQVALEGADALVGRHDRRGHNHGDSRTKQLFD